MLVDNWKMVKLIDVCAPKQWRTISKKDLIEKGYPVYGAGGIIGYTEEYNHEKETVIVGCRGTCGNVLITEKFSYINGNAMALDNLKEDIISKKYLLYYLKKIGFNEIITGTTQKQITREGLNNYYISFPDLGNQKKIVDILEKAEKALDKRKEATRLLDELVKSKFIEMFGDTITNPKEYENNCLESLADIVSGITKGRKTNNKELIQVPYMRVANVKDGYIDWSEIKTIDATKEEIERYRLLEDDVLMTEGGDADKLGRGSILYNPPNNCIHQNHIFRVRLNKGIINPVYFSEYLKHPLVKFYFLKSAKQTTGIASINMTQLKKAPILLPPIELQNQFADFVKQVNKLKFEMQKSLEEMENNFNSLMQRAFKGELII